LNTIRYYHIVPQIVREPERSAGRKFDPYGGDFIEQIASLPVETQRSRLQRIGNVLRGAIPQLRELHIGKDFHGVPHLEGMYGPKRLVEPWQTETSFSDGTLRLIGLLWALLDEGGPLLLEEPELSLHPGIVRYIPGMMASIQNEYGRQILVSTHSYDLLRNEGIAPDEVLILHPGDDGTRVELGTEISVVRQLVDSGLTIAEAALPFAKRLLAHVGLVAGDVFGKRGKADLLKRLPNYNNASRFAPWFAIIDLDNDAVCASQVLEKWLPEPEAGLRLRVAVRAIEAWIMADVERLAPFFLRGYHSIQITMLVPKKH
jgi:hypothetical protein